MPPVVLGCLRWWSVRRALRMFTSLAVAVVLALSGGAHLGGLPAASPPAGPSSVEQRQVRPTEEPARGASVVTGQAVPEVPAAAPLTGRAVAHRPVRPLAATDAGVAASRAPPRR